LVPAPALADQPLPLKDFLPADVVVSALGVGQFGAGEVLVNLPQVGGVLVILGDNSLDCGD
jgi:hypothetical protein